MELTQGEPCALATPSTTGSPRVSSGGRAGIRAPIRSTCRSSAPLDELTFHPKVTLVGETQFTITTHSPIILGYPDAWIYQTGGNGLERVEYEDTDRFQVTRNFLNHRQTLLDTLLSDD